MGKTIIIIPAYNEEETIAKLIERSKKYADICIVNDGSKDRTSEIVQSYKDVIQIRHEKNMHIPQTIRDGMIYAYNNNYDYVITMDAGLSHLPEELPLFIKYPHCDMLVGYRELIIDVPLHRRIISKIGTLFINMAISKFSYKSFSTPFFKDITSGYRRYSKNSLQKLVSNAGYISVKSGKIGGLLSFIFHFFWRNISFILKRGLKMIFYLCFFGKKEVARKKLPVLTTILDDLMHLHLKTRIGRMVHKSIIIFSHKLDSILPIFEVGYYCIAKREGDGK